MAVRRTVILAAWALIIGASLLTAAACRESNKVTHWNPSAYPTGGRSWQVTPPNRPPNATPPHS